MMRTIGVAVIGLCIFLIAAGVWFISATCPVGPILGPSVQPLGNHAGSGRVDDHEVTSAIHQPTRQTTEERAVGGLVGHSATKMVRGRVYSTSSVPLPGIAIDWLADGYDSRGATTAADGVFELLVPVEAISGTIRARDTSGYRALNEAAYPAELYHIFMVEHQSITVQVEGIQGELVAGATVRLEVPLEAYANALDHLSQKGVTRAWHGVTDLSGIFVAIGVPRGVPAAIAVDAPGYAPEFFLAAESETFITMVLKPKHVLIGRVVDSATLPIEGAVVSMLTSEAVTNASGRFELSYGGFPSWADLSICASGHAPWAKPFATVLPMASSDGGFVAYLERAQVLKCRVLQSAGDPCVGYSLRLVSRALSFDPEKQQYVSAERRCGVESSARTTTGGIAVFEGLASGPFQMDMFSDQGRYLGRTGDLDIANDLQVIVLPADALESKTVQFADLEGNGLGDVIVEIALRGYGLEDIVVARGITGEGGALDLPAHVFGNAQLRARKDGFITLDKALETGADGHVLIMKRARKLRLFYPEYMPFEAVVKCFDRDGHELDISPWGHSGGRGAFGVLRAIPPVSPILSAAEDVVSIQILLNERALWVVQVPNDRTADVVDIVLK